MIVIGPLTDELGQMPPPYRFNPNVREDQIRSGLEVAHPEDWGCGHGEAEPPDADDPPQKSLEEALFGKEGARIVKLENAFKEAMRMIDESSRKESELTIEFVYKVLKNAINEK